MKTFEGFLKNFKDRATRKKRPFADIEDRVDEGVFIPLDIRRRFDDDFDGDNYKGENIDSLYEKRFVENGIYKIFEKNSYYLEYIKKIIIGKRVRFTRPYGEENANGVLMGKEYVNEISSVIFNDIGLLVFSNGMSFSKCVDERLPVTILSDGRKYTEEDPYGEEDWDQ